MAIARLIAYLVGVASLGTIAQGAVGNALHDAVWTTPERALSGEAPTVTETTTTLSGVTVTRAVPPDSGTSPTGSRAGETTPTPARTTTLTVPGPTTTTTTTVSGPAVTTTVSSAPETVSTPGPAVTTTVSGPAITTTVTGPTRTVPAPAVTTTVAGPTETVTVTVTTACEPAPKKPVDPPCPPHK